MAIDPKKLAAFANQSRGNGPMPNKKKGLAALGGGGGGGKPNGKHHDDHHDSGHDQHDDGGGDDKHIVEEVVQEMKQGHHDEQLEGLMKNFDPEHGHPGWAADGDVWDRAMKAVDPDGEGSHYDEPYSVVAHVYKKMGGAVENHSEHSDDDDHGHHDDDDDSEE